MRRYCALGRPRYLTRISAASSHPSIGQIPCAKLGSNFDGRQGPLQGRTSSFSGFWRSLKYECVYFMPGAVAERLRLGFVNG